MPLPADPPPLRQLPERIGHWRRAMTFPHACWNKQQNKVGVAAGRGFTNEGARALPASAASQRLGRRCEVAARGLHVDGDAAVSAVGVPLAPRRQLASLLVDRNAAAVCSHMGLVPNEADPRNASFPSGGSPRRAATRWGPRGRTLGEPLALNSASGGLDVRRRAVHRSPGRECRPVALRDLPLAVAEIGRPRPFGGRVKRQARSRSAELLDQLLPGRGAAHRHSEAAGGICGLVVSDSADGDASATPTQRRRRR